MAQGTAKATAPDRVWLSFPALFSDGDSRRDITDIDAQPEAVEGASEAYSLHSEDELGTIRMDIYELQEAIKNHDLWVQDAAAMRTDTDELQASNKEHESWMSNISVALRKMQERANRFDGELLDLRRRTSDRGAAKAGSSLRRVASFGNCGGASPSASLPPMDVASAKMERETADLAFGGAANERIELALTQQLNQGLSMLRTMVTTVEGGLARQIEGERAARRAALEELRQELAILVPRPSTSTVSTALHRSLVSDNFGGLDAGFLASVDKLAGGERVVVTPNLALDFFPEEDALLELREAMSSLERRAEERATETENALSVLRTDFEVLRAKQKLEAVAAGALALASGSLTSQARLRAIKALEERACLQTSQLDGDLSPGFLSAAGQGQGPGSGHFARSPAALLEEAEANSDDYSPIGLTRSAGYHSDATKRIPAEHGALPRRDLARLAQDEINSDTASRPRPEYSG